MFCFFFSLFLISGVLLNIWQFLWANWLSLVVQQHLKWIYMFSLSYFSKYNCLIFLIRYKDFNPHLHPSRFQTTLRTLPHVLKKLNNLNSTMSHYHYSLDCLNLYFDFCWHSKIVNAKLYNCESPKQKYWDYWSKF